MDREHQHGGSATEWSIRAADGHFASEPLFRRPVFHGVLDDGLKDERRDRIADSPGTSSDAEPLLETRALDIEVRLDHLELASERRELAFRSEHARSSAVSRSSVSSARGGAVLIRWPIVVSALNRKCGLICARSARSSASVARRPSLARGSPLVPFFVIRMASMRRATIMTIASSVARSSEKRRRPRVSAIVNA